MGGNKRGGGSLVVKGVELSKEMTYHKYMKRKSELVIEITQTDDGGFTARGIGEDIFSEGNTLEEIRRNLREAVLCHYDSKDDIPSTIRLHWVKEEILSL